jgi:hypothetical protein
MVDLEQRQVLHVAGAVDVPGRDHPCGEDAGEAAVACAKRPVPPKTAIDCGPLTLPMQVRGSIVNENLSLVFAPEASSCARTTTWRARSVKRSNLTPSPR